MSKCQRCLALDEKPVDTEPHSRLGDKQVVMEDGAREEHYTCVVCHTRWRRKKPQGPSPEQHYRWTQVG
jgi:hypothetical protein